MILSLNSYIIVFEKGKKQPLIDWWDYDRYNNRIQNQEAHHLMWSLDGKPVSHGGSNTVSVVTNKKDLSEADAKELVQAFETEHAAIIKTIKYAQDEREKARRKFNDLVHLLTKLWKLDDVPFYSADWSVTQDGRLFPFLVFEDRSLPIGRERRKTSKSGRVCPKCGSWDVKEDGRKPYSSGKDYALWIEDWHCESCQDRWEYMGGWSD